MVPSIEQEIHDLHELIGSSLDPEGRAFVPLADAYRRVGDPSRARELVEQGLARHPDLAAAHLVSGWICRDLADDRGAESAFLKVLELDRDNARALVGLGRLLLAGGHEEGGTALLERGLALDPVLAGEGAPARVPRHSGNPEIVGAQELAPMDWEVLAEEDGPTADPSEIEPLVTEATVGEGPVGEGPVADELVPEPSGDVVDLAALAPDVAPESPGEAPGSSPSGEASDPGVDPTTPPEAAAGPILPDAGGDEPHAPLLTLDAEEELLRGIDPTGTEDGSPEAGGEPWPAGGLDIEWEVESFYEPHAEAPDGAPTEPGADPVAAPLVGAEAGGDAHPDAPAEAAPEADSDAPAALDATFDAPDPFIAALADVGALAPAAELPAAPADEPLAAPALAPDPTAEAVARHEPSEGAIVPPDASDDEVVLDPWSLAPDGWTPGPTAGATAIPADEDLLMNLADLAPDVVPEARTPSGREHDAVLPTRTLGELYARQGLLVEAIDIYRQLAGRDSADPGLRTRLAELQAELAGEPASATRAGTRGPAALEERGRVDESARVSGVDSAEEATVGAFLARLLAWDGSSGGSDPSGTGA